MGFNFKTILLQRSTFLITIIKVPVNTNKCFFPLDDHSVFASSWGFIM